MTKFGIIYAQVLRKEKYIFNDTQITVIGSMKPEICTKMLRNLSEKLWAKFSSTTLGYSVIWIVCLDDAFCKILELKTSPVEGQPLQQKDKQKCDASGLERHAVML